MTAPSLSAIGERASAATEGERFEWRCHTPNLLAEIMTNKGAEVLRTPLMIFGALLHEVATRAAQINDAALNTLMLRLTLYDAADLSKHSSEEVQAAFDSQDGALDILRECERLEAENARLVQFARWAIQEGPWDGCDLDGGSVQEKAEALGLIKQEPYDPAKHGDAVGYDCVPEEGDPWYTFSAALVNDRAEK